MCNTWACFDTRKHHNRCHFPSGSAAHVLRERARDGRALWKCEETDKERHLLVTMTKYTGLNVDFTSCYSAWKFSSGLNISKLYLYSYSEQHCLIFLTFLKKMLSSETGHLILSTLWSHICYRAATNHYFHY